MTDWRLQGQERYLGGVALTRRTWKQSRPGWNHDHCEFCWATFAEFEGPDILHHGWTTLDSYHWICDTCFADFHDQFKWRVG